MDLPPEIRKVASDAASSALDHLDVTAHNPVQGMAMHKVVAEAILIALGERGYLVETSGVQMDVKIEKYDTKLLIARTVIDEHSVTVMYQPKTNSYVITLHGAVYDEDNATRVALYNYDGGGELLLVDQDITIREKAILDIAVETVVPQLVGATDAGRATPND